MSRRTFHLFVALVRAVGAAADVMIHEHHLAELADQLPDHRADQFVLVARTFDMVDPELVRELLERLDFEPGALVRLHRHLDVNARAKGLLALFEPGDDHDE